MCAKIALLFWMYFLFSLYLQVPPFESLLLCRRRQPHLHLFGGARHRDTGLCGRVQLCTASGARRSSLGGRELCALQPTRPAPPLRRSESTRQLDQKGGEWRGELGANGGARKCFRWRLRQALDCTRFSALRHRIWGLTITWDEAGDYSGNCSGTVIADGSIWLFITRIIHHCVNTILGLRHGRSYIEPIEARASPNFK